ncbi:MAG: DUF6077 domain-containing protein [Acidobacteriota bacterium]
MSDAWRRPLTAATDPVVLAFAGWTLLCHLATALGGSLDELIMATIMAAILVAAAAWMLRQRADRTAGEIPHGRVLIDPLAGRYDAILLVALVAGGASFTSLPSWLLLTLGALALASVAARDALRPAAIRPAPPARAPAWILVAIALVAALAATSLHRPDADDAYYLRLAARAVDHPDAPLMRWNPIQPEIPIRPSDQLRTFEMSLAAASRLTGMSVLAIDHLWVPALCALLMVAAQARLLRRLAPERWLVALLVLMIVLLTVGGVHRWHGNFAFARLWQGKSILLSCLLPLATVYGLDYGRRPSGRGFGRLAAAHLAGMGLSPPGLWMVPAVSMLAVCSAASSWRPVLTAPIASLYSLVWGGWLHVTMGSTLSTSAETVTAVALTDDAATLVLGDGSLRVAACLAMATAWWTCRSVAARRFCLLAPLACAISLNPAISRWIAETLVHTSIFWRLLWLIPLPVFLALMLTAPYAWPDRPDSRRTRLLATAGLLVAFLGFGPEHWLISEANRTQVRPWQLKAPTQELEAARLLADHVAPDEWIVAPEEITAWLATLHHPPRPLVVRSAYLIAEPEERQLLIWLSRLAGSLGQDPRGLQRFLEEIGHRQLSGLCVRAGSDALTVGLMSLGYGLADTAGPWQIWVLGAEDLEVDH